MRVVIGEEGETERVAGKMRAPKRKQKNNRQKKIKLFRKENEELTNVIEERQQADTNLLLQSKQILTNNSKLQKTIAELKEQIQTAKRNKAQQKNDLSKNQKDLAQDNPPIKTGKKPIPTLATIKQLTVTQATLQIDLPNCELKDQQFAVLKNFSQLRALTVNQNLLSNPSISLICLNLSNLEKLNLANNKFTSQSLGGIKNLKHLKVLDIRNNNLGDEAIRHISELESLCDLSCSKNNLSDNCSSDIGKLSNLSYLDITNNLITSESVKDLTNLKKITHLYLMSNRLSREGVIDLIKNSQSLQFLDVRFNVWQNEEKQQIRKHKSPKLQILC